MRGAQKNRAISLVSDLQEVGFDVRWPHRNTIRPHVGAETAPHWALKCMVCRRINELGDIFYTEVDHPERGVPDILWCKLEDERAYVIETESGVDRDTEVEYAKQYTDNGTCPVVADCFTYDAIAAPTDVLELKHWVEERVV